MTGLLLSAAPVLCLLSWLGSTSEHGQSWETLVDAALRADKEGRYLEAEKLYRDAEKEAHRFGQDDPRLAQTLALLGRLYSTQARWSEAESFLQRSLAIYEKAWGPDSRDVASVLNFIGNLHKQQAK